MYMYVAEYSMCVANKFKQYAVVSHISSTQLCQGHRGETFDMHGKVLSQGMCVLNLKGVFKWI